LYSKLKDAEKKEKVRISSTYMTGQSDINARMRAILVDWLVEVHHKYNLQTVTLFLTVQLLDRFLQASQTHRKQLQLAGLGALLIASKFEEKSPVMVKDLVYICDNAYTKKDVNRMEAEMLTTVAFNLCTPTASHFLDLYKQANRCDDIHSFVVQYLMELAFVDMEISGEPPSKIAAAATLSSNVLLDRDVCWPEGMASYTGFSEHALLHVSQKMRELLAAAPTSALGQVFRKFSHPKFGSVAGRFP